MAPLCPALLLLKSMTHYSMIKSVKQTRVKKSQIPVVVAQFTSRLSCDKANRHLDAVNVVSPVRAENHSTLRNERRTAVTPDRSSFCLANC